MFSVLWKLSMFFTQHWKRYTLAIILLMAGGVLETIPPKLLGLAIDAMYLDGFTKATLWKYAGWLIALSLFIYTINYLWIYRLFGGAFLLEKSMRSRLMRHFSLHY
ncbi:hypothetical protein AF2641_10505 [Anoxybacillus flavithermus]|nr:hypothetical protein AF2641_10505 [Anoxybacillus flavithermus]